jgi:hypothetical protein
MPLGAVTRCGAPRASTRPAASPSRRACARTYASARETRWPAGAAAVSGPVPAILGAAAVRMSKFGLGWSARADAGAASAAASASSTT